MCVGEFTYSRPFRGATSSKYHRILDLYRYLGIAGYESIDSRLGLNFGISGHTIVWQDLRILYGILYDLRQFRYRNKFEHFSATRMIKAKCVQANETGFTGYQ